MTTNNVAPKEYQGFGVLVAILLLPIELLVWGSVATVLYRWFILPLWEALPHISAARMVGIAILVALWQRHPKPPEDIWEALGRSFANHILYPLISLLIGVIIKTWWL